MINCHECGGVLSRISLDGFDLYCMRCGSEFKLVEVKK